MVFGGATEHSLDKKHRMHLAKRILSQIPLEEQAKLVLARGLDGCLFLFPPPAWASHVEKFTRSIPATSDGRNFLRLYFASVSEVGVDSQGRILLSETLRELGGVTDRVVVNGMGDHVEIWSTERWAKLQETTAGAFEKMYQKLSTEYLGGPA